MKPLNIGQIIILLIIGLVTVAYLSARSYSNNSSDDYGDFDILIEASFPLEGQDSVDLNLSSENIYITTGDSDSFDIRYENHVFSEKAKNDLYDSIIIEETGKTIKVSKKHTTSINFNWIDSFFYFMDNGFKSDVVSGKLEVILPKGYDQKLVSTTSSGNNSATDLTVTSLMITASSGNIDVLDSNAQAIEATASSGRIKLTDVLIDGELTSTSSSGNQLLDGITSSEIDAKASSGKITINGQVDSLKASTSSGNIDVAINAEDQVTLNASSGTIRFAGESDSVDASSSSGNIYVELDSVIDDYELQSSSGTINITVPRDAEFTFESTSSSGNFKPEMDVNYTKENDDHAKGYYNSKNADAHLQLSSTSGNQYIKH